MALGFGCAVGRSAAAGGRSSTGGCRTSYSGPRQRGASTTQRIWTTCTFVLRVLHHGQRAWGVQAQVVRGCVTQRRREEKQQQQH